MDYFNRDWYLDNSVSHRGEGMAEVVDVVVSFAVVRVHPVGPERILDLPATDVRSPKSDSTAGGSGVDRRLGLFFLLFAYRL